MSDPDDDLEAADREALLRWRLALGPGAEQVSPQFSLDALRSLAASYDIEPSRVGDLDQALSFVYEERDAGLGASRPYIPRWLAALREFFRGEVVALVQKDAIEKKGLTNLLFEPETLPLLEKNVELVATLLAAKGLVPDTAREAARQIVREVVDEVRKKLETEVRTAVIGAVRRDRQSPLKIARNIDWKRTVQRNLKGWDPARRVLLPERFYFWANQRRRHEWDVAILVDQSGSMAESVVYSSIMAAIFASIEVLRTRLLFFDTEVVDVTDMLTDPVDVLFASQLGGGTDINRAVAYAQARFIERPDKTLFILVSDLYEGGDRGALLARMAQLVESRVKVVSLLALSDSGKPAFDHEIASALGRLGVPCFGCTPKMLPALIERVMKGQDLGPLTAESG